MILRFSLGSFLLIFGAFLISACGSSPPLTVEMTPTAESSESDSSPALEPAATMPVVPTTEPLPLDYPPALPVQPTYPPDYPGPPTRTQPGDPYPGGMVWITRPVGIQCEDGTAPGYGDLRESVATLTAAGLRVYESEMVNYMVTTSCGSPTSAHYRVHISSVDLDSAISMGWGRDQN